MINFHNLSTAELFERLNASTAESEEYFKEQCWILLELSNRGEWCPAMKRAPTKFFRMVTSGEVSARAVYLLHEFEPVLKALAGLPPERQNSLAVGEEIAVAEFDASGEIVTRMKTVETLTAAELSRVFRNGAIRIVAQQTKELRKAPAPKPRKTGKVVADRENGILVLHCRRVHPEDLTEPLKELGFKLERLPK
jgi:hypothetical protein